MNTFDSVLDDDHMEPYIKRAWLMADNPLMHDNGSGLITLDEYAKRRIKQGLETADKRIKELTAENERLYQEWKVAAGANDGLLKAIKQLQEIVGLGITKNAELTAEITRLTAALVECQQAFDNGRNVGERSVGYEELEY